MVSTIPINMLSEQKARVFIVKTSNVVTTVLERFMYISHVSLFAV
jgi:hypothetical protein